MSLGKERSKDSKRPVRAKDLLPQLKREMIPLKRKMLLLGYLTDRLEKKSQSLVLVGGQAVETYTGGQFTTGDVDIVTSDREITEQILSGLGFERIGMIWLSEKLGIAVQIVGAFPRSRSMIRTIEVGPYNVRVVGVEDLIIDRLAAAKFWKRPSDTEQARVLFANFRNQLDLGYLKKRAREEHVLDILDRTKKTRASLGSKLSDRKPEEDWKNLKAAVRKRQMKHVQPSEEEIQATVRKYRHKKGQSF